MLASQATPLMGNVPFSVMIAPLSGEWICEVGGRPDKIVVGTEAVISSPVPVTSAIFSTWVAVISEETVALNHILAV